MTDQQRPVPGPEDDGATPVAGPADGRATRADEPTRPLRRPVTPVDGPAVGTAGEAAGPPPPDQGDEPTDAPEPTVVSGGTAGDDAEPTALTPPRPDEEPTTRLQPFPPASPDIAPEAEETHRLTDAQVRAATAAPDSSAGRVGGAVAADDPATVRPAAGEAAPASPEPVTPDAGGDPVGVPEKAAPWQRLSSAGALIWVLLALFGFTLVVQLRSNDTDQGLAGARQDDLVRILSDLEARDTRLQAEINALESSRQQLTSGVAGREAALAEADKRADELGLLAGTLPGRGPGLEITIARVKASEILNAVQELRGAGGEVMQISGAGGGVVRIVASTYFVDAQGGGIVVDGTRLGGPYTLTVIGVPQTMQTALEIPGGVVASVQSDGGSVTMEQRTSVEVTAVRKATSLQYARPVS